MINFLRVFQARKENISGDIAEETAPVSLMAGTAFLRYEIDENVFVTIGQHIMYSLQVSGLFTFLPELSP